MKRKIFAVCMSAVLLLAGCGGGNSASNGAMAGGNSMPASSASNNNYWDMAESEVGFAPEAPMEGQEAGGSSIYQNPGAKLIRRAEFDIQTEQFDQSVQALNQLVASCGGYFETASVYGGGFRDVNAARWGNYTVRVPAEKYDQFFASAGDLGYITSRTESSEDVGEQYYDTEARLKTQRTKQERLLALLEKAETMEDIIALESALSEVEYQIEQYSSTLNRYDALIGFATFNIYLNEVSTVTREVGETASLWSRMAAGLQASFRGLVRGSQDFLVWASYHIVLLVILAGVAAVAVAVGRRELKKLEKKKAQKPDEE